MPAKKTIVVIGAGIAGTSAAAALADSCHVSVLEQEAHAGYHATGRSAATWAPFYGPEVIQKLTAHSLPLLANPHRDFSENPFTSPKGELMLGRKEDKQEIEKHLALGMQSLSLEEAREKVPLIKAGTVETILYTDNMLDIDVDALHQAYIRHLKKQGGKLFFNAAVKEIACENSQWQISTADTTFSCDVLINAAGAWADHIAVLAGIKPIGIQAKRRTAALVPYLDDTNMANWPMVFGAGENFYCTPFGNGLMISPADATPVEPHDAWPDELDIAKGINEFQQYIDYDVQRIDSQWAGLRTFATDGEPVVGFSPEAEGFFWLAGQGGYGIQTSPAIAEICRQSIGESTFSESIFGDFNSTLYEDLSPGRFV